MNYLYVGLVSAEIAGPIAASALMRISPWIPSLVGLALPVLSIVFVLVLRDSWQQATSTSPPSDPVREATGGVPALLEAESADSVELFSPTHSSAARQQQRPSQPASMAKTFRRLLQRNTILVAPLFFVLSLRYILLGILVQYASARFGWDIADSGIFQSEVAVVGLVQYALLMPAFSRWLRRVSPGNPEQADIRSANYSILCLFLGSIFIGLSGSGLLLIPGSYLHFREVLDPKGEVG